MLNCPESAAPAPPPARAESRRFARRLLLALSALVAVATTASVFVARAHLAEVQHSEAELRFAADFAAEHTLQTLRASALADRVRVLATRPRIHAALEDDALDLLYLAAQDDLHEALAAPGLENSALRARFYRLADATGSLIEPPASIPAGLASPEEIAASARLATAPTSHASRAWVVSAQGTSTELLAQPLFSNADGHRIGCLVLGYSEVPQGPADPAGGLPARWHAGRIHAPRLPATLRQTAETLLADQPSTAAPNGRLNLRADGGDWLVFYRADTSPGDPSQADRNLWFAPLASLARRQNEATWRIVGAGSLLALVGLAAAGLLTASFGRWFGHVATAEESQRAGRAEAESRLQRTAAELERAARFSADASHQLKTPLAVLRLGLDELASAPAFPADRQPDLEELRRQTEKLGYIIDDLLLLARLDAGLVRLAAEPVNLASLAEAALDDLSALHDEAALRLVNKIDAPLPVRGDRRLLALVLQNLAENAAKYNRPGGLVRLRATRDSANILLRVENTAPRPVPADAHEAIFLRFHRGGAGAETPGHGLGLNLARELARLHGGDLALERSDAELTVFTLSLPAA